VGGEGEKTALIRHCRPTRERGKKTEKGKRGGEGGLFPLQQGRKRGTRKKSGEKGGRHTMAVPCKGRKKKRRAVEGGGNSRFLKGMEFGGRRERPLPTIMTKKGGKGKEGPAKINGGGRGEWTPSPFLHWRGGGKGKKKKRYLQYEKGGGGEEKSVRVLVGKEEEGKARVSFKRWKKKGKCLSSLEIFWGKKKRGINVEKN